jgi:thiosulfate/3-mercaptopyruvate sulfurtransferase
LTGPLIHPAELAERLTAPPDSRPAVLDVRWDLTGPKREEYLAGHVPTAAFINLDTVLADPPGPGGRHPLPDVERFASSMRRAGVRARTAVVVYDASTSLAAARAWWLLRYHGHDDVRVLDGGLSAWVAAGYPIEKGAAAPAAGDFVANPGGMRLLDARGARQLPHDGLLIDARAPERFRGEHEPIDPVAGHIPGAVNLPATENLEPGGRFLPPGELRRAFERAGVRNGTSVGAYCGSGVTAAHEVLALELAGFPAGLYVGSWSEWVTDPDRPVATGA